MDAQHTPGPWVVNDLYAETEIRGPQNSGAMICVMSPWGIAADEPNPQRANARLIAAAPDLLAALKECVEDSEAAVNYHIDCYGERWRPARLAAMRETVARARAAIARAEGRS